MGLEGPLLHLGEGCVKPVLVQVRKAKGRRAARAHMMEGLSGCIDLLGESHMQTTTACSGLTFVRLCTQSCSGICNWLLCRV